MKRASVVALADTLSGLAIVAWVGGHAALGAFAARILFRDLPRALAARTMTTVFRSFDGLIWIALLLLLGATVARVAAVGARIAVDQLAIAAALSLLALGLFELSYVHPQIEAMFEAGRTLEPAFASLHRLSERCGHLELLLSALLLGSHAWARARPCS